jgi:hypothetical protein
MLAKQCLVGVSGQPFAFILFLAMVAAKGLSMATVCFISFELCSLQLLTAFFY